MSPNFIPDPRPLAFHPQRPWRPVRSKAGTRETTVIRSFAAPVVRELPPRREQVAAAAGTW